MSHDTIERRIVTLILWRRRDRATGERRETLTRILQGRLEAGLSPNVEGMGRLRADVAKRLADRGVDPREVG